MSLRESMLYLLITINVFEINMKSKNLQEILFNYSVNK